MVSSTASVSIGCFETDQVWSCVWPPCALIIASHLRLMDHIRHLSDCCGMVSRSWMTAWQRLCTVFGGCSHCCSQCFNSSQTHSVGDRSGEMAGLGMVSDVFDQEFILHDSCSIMMGIIWLQHNLWSMCNQVHCVCPGPWPFNLFFPVVLSHFWLGGSFMALIIWSVKTCALGPPHPLSPSVPADDELMLNVLRCHETY